MNNLPQKTLPQVRHPQIVSVLPQTKFFRIKSNKELPSQCQDSGRRSLTSEGMQLARWEQAFFTFGRFRLVGSLAFVSLLRFMPTHVRSLFHSESQADADRQIT